MELCGTQMTSQVDSDKNPESVEIMDNNIDNLRSSASDPPDRCAMFCSPPETLHDKHSVDVFSYPVPSTLITGVLTQHLHPGAKPPSSQKRHAGGIYPYKAPDQRERDGGRR